MHCALSAGKPAATRNLFCAPGASGGVDTCFNLNTSSRSYDAAKAACEAMTGNLVYYSSAAKQLMVEMVRGPAAW